MAGIAPNSTVILFKDIPFDPAYNDTMYFAGSAAQKTWFDSQDGQTARSKRRVYSSLSYQRRSDNTIRLEEAFSWAYNVNYMAFQNTSFENKWFYAFVENVEYVNDVTIEITFRLDVIQSWLFGNTTTNLSDFMSQCTIERCHTVTDNFGENTLPESVPLGDYIYQDADTPLSANSSYTASPCIIIASTVDMSGTHDFQAGQLYEGRITEGAYYSGLTYGSVSADATGVDTLNQLLKALNAIGMGKAIVSLSMGDSNFFSTTPGDVISPAALNVNRPSSLGSYTVKNKKLLTYPYCMAAVSDSNGHENIYNWELFDYELVPGSPTITVQFEVWGNRCCNPSLICYPTYYKGQEKNFDEAMESMQFPACAWETDTFMALLAQAWSTPMLQLAGNVATQNWVGAAGTVTGAAVGLAALAANPENSVPTLHGISSANLGYAANGVMFKVRVKMIKPEYAAVIDEYFDRYGYRVEQTGVPNIAARPNWTYVKTRGASVHGYIPAAEAREIEQIFDNGIRFWKTTAAAGFGNYNTSNAPASQNSGSGSGGSSSDPTPVTPTPTTPTENEGE